MHDEHRGFATRQVHAGTDVATATPRATPIHLTAGFPFSSFDEAAAHFATGEGFGYTRIGNPTIDAVERKLAALDGGTGALLVASGQAALATAILAVAEAGDHIVASDHIYEGSRGLLVDQLSRFGIAVTFVNDIRSPRAWEDAVRPETRALFAETLSNAANVLLDVRAIADVADAHGIPLIVDATFSTPYLQRPIESGAALVVHSASKFLAGQGSVLGGVVIDGGRFDVARDGAASPHLIARGPHGEASYAQRFGTDARLAFAREVVASRLGPTISPLNAFLIGQGVETLSVRVREQSRSAAVIARHLDAHPAVAHVDHLSLPSHPDHALAERLLPKGRGSVFTVTLHGGIDAARTVIESLSVFTHMTHLGDVRSLVLHPATTSHVHSTPQQRAAVGVHDGTLRLSIGLEDTDDLIADLDAALATV